MNSFIHKLSFFFIISILISACSIPETKIYDLHLNDSEKSKNIPYRKTDPSIAIHVEAPSYLSQPYIVTRTSPYQIQISKTAKWEAPPKRFIRQGLQDILDGLRYFKHVSLSQTQPEGYYWLAVDLKKFELLDEEKGFFGELLMDVSLFDHEKNRLFQRTIAMKEKLGNKDFMKLAHVLSTFLTEGLEEIKLSVIRQIQK